MCFILTILHYRFIYKSSTCLVTYKIDYWTKFHTCCKPSDTSKTTTDGPKNSRTILVTFWVLLARRQIQKITTVSTRIYCRPVVLKMMRKNWNWVTIMTTRTRVTTVVLNGAVTKTVLKIRMWWKNYRKNDWLVVCCPNTINSSFFSEFCYE